MDLEEEQRALIQELARTVPHIAETFNQILEVLRSINPNFETQKVDLSNSAFHEQVAVLNLAYGELRLIESYLARLMPDYKSHLSPASDPETYRNDPRRNKDNGYPTE